MHLNNWFETFQAGSEQPTEVTHSNLKFEMFSSFEALRPKFSGWL